MIETTLRQQDLRKLGKEAIYFTQKDVISMI